MAEKPKAEVVEFPKSPPTVRKESSTERIWGKAVYGHGYAGIPSILLKAQRRIGISPLQMNIVIQLLDYWHEPTRRPFPTKRDLANRIGVAEKTIQNNVRELEKAGLISRESRKTAAGDYASNIYHLDGLIAKVKALEPEFTAERQKRKEAKAALETPAGRRKLSERSGSS
jgi:predicted transcriptional regulator